MICYVSVTFADVGVHKVSKKEYASVFEMAVIDYSFVITKETATPLVFGILNTDIAIPQGETAYLCKENKNYKSKKIDRKWVWWYSIVSNT